MQKIWWLVLIPMLFALPSCARKGKATGLEGRTTASKALYHCPMHPDYVSDKPGDCPICGMKLVPVKRGKAKERSDQKYHCPMHPQYVTDRPGECPICGMSLVPVKEEAPPAISKVPGYAVVQISPEKQQLIGVRTEVVRKRHLTKVIRTDAKVEYDERKVCHVHTKVEGWIEKVFVNYVGEVVRKGQPLFTLYSPDLVATQEEYLLALREREALKNSPLKEMREMADSLVEAVRRRLLLWDVSPGFIRQLERTRKVKRTVTFYSPASGVVVSRKAYPGMHVTPHTEIYTIADLSTVWILADIYEQDIPLIKVGQEATATLTYYPGKVFKGRISYIYPFLEEKTRTVKVRMVFKNPGFLLKPGMFADVTIKVDLGTKLAVSEEAVLDTGERQIVFVALEGGYFEPREVRLGRKAQGYYEVLSGLKEGERVVTSGNFLVDSESRLKAALKAMEKPKMKALPKKPKGKALYHCPMHPDYVSDKPGDCPICGMKLVPVKR